MKKTIDTAADHAAIETAPQQAAPKGIGMAVALDWGFGAQFLVAPVLSRVFGISGFGVTLPKTTNPAMASLIMFVVTLPVMLICFGFGEGVRRGWRWTRYVQVTINTLLFLGGFVSLFSLWQAIGHRNYWPIATTVILLFISPVIAWRMSRPETGHWFATVTSAEARKRHGGMWMVYIALWAIAGATLQVLAGSFR